MNPEAEHPVHRAARELVAWAWSDSRVQLDRYKLRELLNADSETSGYVPTDEQCAAFIMGDDTGEVPAQLIADFPKTHAYVATFWE